MLGKVKTMEKEKVQQVKNLVDAIFECKGYQDALKGIFYENDVTLWVGPRLHQIKDILEKELSNSTDDNTRLISLTITGRRWFNRTKGHSYFSYVIDINGKQVYYMPYSSGYGSQYEYDAIMWLKENNYIPEHVGYGGSFSIWCREQNIVYHSVAIDVQRKKDL